MTCGMKLSSIKCKSMRVFTVNNDTAQTVIAKQIPNKPPSFVPYK